MRRVFLLVSSLAVAQAFFVPKPHVNNLKLGVSRPSLSPVLSHGGIGGGNDNNNNNNNGGGGMWGGNWGDEFNGDDFNPEDFAISGLGALPMQLWDGYNNKLASNPLETKALTSLVGFTIGDLLAQSFLGEKGAPVDLKRLARMASFGAFVHGPIGHYFYGFLDSQFPGTAAQTVALKVLIDQVAWAPIFTVIFFSWIEILQGHSLKQLGDKIKQDLVRGVTASWKVWPVVHVINFRFIPNEQRLLYINTIQIGYNIFLSLLASKKA